MIKELMKKYFSSSQDELQPAQATQEEVVTMIEPNEQATAPADNTAELSAQLETVTASLTALQAQFAELTTNHEAAQAALNASEEAKATLATQAASKRLEARTEAIKVAVGTSKVDALLAATDGMPDEQFNTIMSAMAASFDAEAKTEMFQEKGVAAEATPVVEVDAVKRLADNIAAQFKTQ